MTYEQFEQKLNEQLIIKEKPFGLYMFLVVNPDYNPGEFDSVFDETEEVEDVLTLLKTHNCVYETLNKHSDEWNKNHVKKLPIILAHTFIISHDNIHLNGNDYHVIGEHAKQRALEEFKNCIDEGYYHIINCSIFSC